MTLLIAAAGANAQTSILDGQITVRSVDIVQNDKVVFVSMYLDVNELDLKSNLEVILTPELRDTEGHIKKLPDIWVVGRNRYYYRMRNDTVAESRYFFRHKKVSTILYETNVPYEAWMKYADLMINEDVCGCGNLMLSNDDMLYGSFVPLFVYVTPPVEPVKTRTLTGSAFIDFPVSQTVIYPDYRGNPAELDKIHRTIDVVKNDPDTRITAISIKGYASPESPYDNNTRLAKGRTQALKEYVQKLYDFPSEIFTTSYEPEDWEGLERYVQASDLKDKEQILAWIRKEMDPDQKEAMIKSQHPESYAFLLRECYPALRHSDYAVEYIIRSYTDVEEMKHILNTSPGKLSLSEIYQIASTYEQGSDEYNDLIETMVHLYPSDEGANLNAANVAMAEGNLNAARKYLEKAGTRPEAEYARGLLLAIEKNYSAARPYIEKAREAGIQEADECLKRIDRVSIRE